MIKIRLLKNWKSKKIGDIINLSKKGADSAIASGVGEYVIDQSEIKINPTALIKKVGKELEKESTTISDEEVYDKLKEISKLELPGEISKELRKLEKNSNYNISELGKQIINIRKSMGMKDSDSVVTSVTNDTHDTHVTNKEIEETVTFVMRNNSYLTYVFGDSNLDEILKILVYSKQAITFGELALKTGKSEAGIKNTISRNKEYFGSIKPKGRKSYIYLLRFGLDVLRLRIDKIKAKEEQIKQEETEKLIKLSEDESKILELKKFYNMYKDNILIEQNVAYIDFNDLVEFSPDYSDELIKNPEDMFNSIGVAFSETLALDKGIRVRIRNLPEHLSLNIENLRSRNLGSLISFEGRIVSISNVRPQVVEAKFECPSCGIIIFVLQLDKKFREPFKCSCGRKGGFKLIDKEMIDTAYIILEDLQEKTDNPHSSRIKCILKEDLVSKEGMKILSPGNEIKCVGILKEVPLKSKGVLSTTFEIIVDVNSVDLCESEIDISKFSDEEVKRIKELSSKIDEEGLSEINTSFAPHIFGHNEIKNAIIFQLCSRRNEPKKYGIRNKLNILMIGDPGTAKSELGKFAIKITPGSRVATGGGSSAVGITASVIREEGEGYRVEPGAMVIAKEILFLDELNNLSDDDKPKLQEGMSEQSITINKANIHMKMKVTAGILAAANPVSGLFKLNEDFIKQYNLPAPIINRFDLIFPIRDIVNKERDLSISRNMINRDRGISDIKYPEDFLKKFFAYIRNFPEPTIDNKISKRIQEIYSLLRNFKSEDININPRIQEAMLRILKSSAKIRMSKKVEEKDIERCIDILSGSYYNIPKYETFKQK